MKQYKNVQDILVGFDLDSAKIAVHRDPWYEHVYRTIFTESFAKAVEYGINVIVPDRQSKMFNSNLAGARAFGFEPYLPAALPSYLLIPDQYLTTNKYGYTYLKPLIELFGNQAQLKINFDSQTYSDLDLSTLGRTPVNQVQPRDLLLLVKQIELNYQCANAGLGQDSSFKYEFKLLEARLLPYYVTVFKAMMEADVAPSLTNQFNPSDTDYLGLPIRQASMVTEVANLPTVLMETVVGLLGLSSEELSKAFLQGVELSNDLALYCERGTFITEPDPARLQAAREQLQARLTTIQRQREAIQAERARWANLTPEQKAREKAMLRELDALDLVARTQNITSEEYRREYQEIKDRYRQTA